ncbi:MAG: response regulator [Verrucomicrobiota bacterium]
MKTVTPRKGPKGRRAKSNPSARETSFTAERETVAPIPLRILMAEDDPHVNNVLELVLTHHGYSVKAACDGIQALSLLQHEPEAFDLILTDHQMPNLNGLGLVRHLRAANYPGKIVVFASPPTPDEQSAYQALRINRLLFKPIENSLLLKAIEEALLER